MMLQTGDEVIYDQNYYMCHSNIENYPQNGNLGDVVCSMSFEDVDLFSHQGESTLPPVESVLPHYAIISIVTPPPSLPSPSIAMNPINNVTNTTQPQLRLQHGANNNNCGQHKLGHNIIHNTMTQHKTQLEPTNPSTNMQPNYNHMVSNNNIISLSSSETKKLTMRKKNNRKTIINDTTTKSNHAVANTSASHVDEVLNMSHSSRDEAAAYVSDASTVDADENDLSNEPFTYLQNLNSDNLMKFSQETQRLYVKPHETVYIDCFYKVKMPIQPLKVRIFPVYTKDISDPVLRCQNHISKDTEPNEIIRNSLLRCENIDAEYNGSDTGKSIRDRYSVVVPLNATVKTSDSNHLKQQVIISFTCNNSCMSRKPTSVLFLLETMGGDILAQRMLSVKISTCPKRDKRLNEQPTNKRRPLAEPDFCPTEPKMAKYDETCIKDEFSRSSYGDPSDDDASGGHDCGGNNNVDVGIDPDSGDFLLTVRSKSRPQILEVLRLMYCNAISNEVFYKTAVNGKKTRDSEYLKRCYEKAVRLKNRQNQAECP